NFDAAARYNYQIPIRGISDQDGLNSRLSKTLNNKNQLSGSFSYGSTLTESPNLFGFRDKTTTAGFDANASWNHRVTTRMFTTLKFDFRRMSTRLTPYFANRENVSGDAGISGNNQDPLNWGPPSLSFSSGVAGLTDGQQQYTRNQSSAISVDTFWNRHGHNVRFGGDLHRLQF